MNTSGKVVISLKYEYVDDFKEGKAQVELNGRYFYINKNGEEIETTKP